MDLTDNTSIKKGNWEKLHPNYSHMYALLRSGEISQSTFDEFNKRHYGVENKLINLAKSLSKKLKTGQDWNSDYKTE